METIWVQGLVGGVLIGISATLLLWFNGRIAGLSHIFSAAMVFTAWGGFRGVRSWRYSPLWPRHSLRCGLYSKYETEGK